MAQPHDHHDHDAGGDPSVLAAKSALREEVWELLELEGVARFPGARNRIPNFRGAEEAAERLRDLEAWRRAVAVKANPDSPQWPVRERALRDGKHVYMAVPRLAADEPFLLLHPERIAQSPRKATSIKGAGRYGEPVGVDALERVDLVVTGCVAVSEDGARLGKGGGFSDLELAVAWEAGLVGPETLVVTTVHELQVRPPGEIPTTDHDVRVDRIVTPERVVDCPGSASAVPGLRWSELTEAKIAAIPLLGRLRDRRR